MPKSKIAISLDGNTLKRLDRLVDGRVFPSRSQAVEVAVREKIDRIEARRLAEECAKLDPVEEKALAEEGLHGAPWPEY